MNKWVKRILLGFAAVILVFITVATIAAFIIQAKIAPVIMQQVNSQVTVPVQVKGGIRFSLLRHFPYASLSFKNVSIDDKLNKGKQLLNVEEFALLFNVLSLMKDKIELTKILIKNGSINVYKNGKGQANYDIIRPSQDTSTAKAKFNVQLKKAEIRNVDLTYVDRASATDVDAHVNHLFLQGDFSDSLYNLSTTVDGTIKKIFSGGQEILAKRIVKADVMLAINNVSGQYVFRKGNITVDDNEFGITGMLASVKNGLQMDFKMVHDGKNIKNLINIIPARYRQSLEGTEGTGAYAVQAGMKGLLSANSIPHITVSADLKNSEFKLGKYKQFLKKVNASARFEMDEKGKTKLVISNFNCQLNDLPFSFKLTVDDLSNPDFDFYAQGVFHMAELSAFVPDSVLSDIDGTVTFTDFHLKGKKQDFIAYDSSHLVGSGQFKFSGIEFTNNGITYGNINGTLRYNNQQIDVNNFTVNFLSNQAELSGTVKNLPAFAYNLSQNRNANNVVLDVNGVLNVKTLNLSGILDTYNKNNLGAAHAKKAATGKIDVREVMNMQGDLDVNIGKFIFRRFEFNDLKGNLQFSPGIIRCNNMDMHAMDGELKLNGALVFGDDYTLHMNYDVTAIDLSLPKIFYQCDNFQQNSLTDKNLKGTLNAAISFNTVLRNYTDIDPDSLIAVADFKITNGELVKFEPLKAASKFIKVNELMDIKFASLANTIKIANRRIDIPRFDIETNALNLAMEGYHFFNDSVDYHFKINLHKFLAQKFNRKRNDLQYMEEDPYEGINLYVSLQGDLNNPQLKFDKGAARKQVKDDFKSEKENLKTLVRNKHVAKANTNEHKKEDKYFDTDEKPQFIDFDSTSK